MSNWPGKYVIGLTGNIATGKSVVRKMLEHLGAYGIDADALSHRAMAKGAPGYQPVLDTFGLWLLDADGQIDRAKLGKLVFNDADALARLEKIIHPLVRQAVSAMATRATQRVIVVEAIKLLEGDLRSACDSIWVTTAPEPVQVDRLVAKRGLSREAALARARAQSPQAGKVAAADVVITNAGSFATAWQQVLTGWQRVVPVSEASPPTTEVGVEGKLAVTRGRPRDSAVIAELVTRLSGGERSTSPDDVMAEFGDRAFLLLNLDGRPVGVAGWQVENLVARTTDFYVDSGVPIDDAFRAMMAEVESASAALQCEASLLFLPQRLAATEASLGQLGYERRTPQSLGVQAWHDAALESAEPGSVMFFKQLRHDRVLRPI